MIPVLSGWEIGGGVGEGWFGGVGGTNERRSESPEDFTLSLVTADRILLFAGG